MTVTFLIFALLLGSASGGAMSAEAQSDAYRIYLYTGEGQSTDFTWTDAAERANVYVFKEPVPEGEDRGKPVGSSVEEVAEKLPGQAEQFVGETGLVVGSHPEYSGETLATEEEYPAENEQVRYLFLIEVGEALYASRAGSLGNLPRYHTLTGLEAGPNVRVQKVHTDLQSVARELVQRVEQKDNSVGEGDQSEPDGKGNDLQSDSTSQEIEGGPASGPEASAKSSIWGTNTFTLLGGGGALGAVMFLLGMVAGRKGSGGKSSGRSRSGAGSGRQSSSSGRSSVNSSNPSGGGGKRLDEEEVKKIVDRRVEKRVEERLSAIENAVEALYREAVAPLQERIDELEKQLADQKDEDNSSGEDERTEGLDELEGLQSSDEMWKNVAREKALKTSGDSSPEEKSSSQRPGQEVASAFVDWCRKGGGQVRRLRHFQSFIEDRIQVDEVRDIQYERDSTSDEFADDARNGITFWLVRKDGHRFVLPSPINNSQFDRLSPVYEGDATPDTLERIRPATLAREAGRLVLQESGKVW